MAADLSALRRLVNGGERGLATVATQRADGSIQATVVNAGVLPHPITGQDVVGFVGIGGARKLDNVRKRARIAIVVRLGFRWQTVEGRATLIGPDDPLDGIDAERLRQLLREVFLSTGSTHDDWPTYDRVMAEERRCVVLIEPERVYGVG